MENTSQPKPEEPFLSVKEEQYTLYPYRWVMQLIFSLNFAVSGFIMIGFSPIAKIISDLYNCSLVVVDFQILLCVIFFIPANFLVINVLKTYNLRVCLTVGAILLMIAAWTRQMIQFTENFTLWATIGNSIQAFAQVFFGNSSSKLASVWFGDRERALSTALGTLAMPIGCIAGFVIPSLMINENDEKDKAVGQAKFSKYLFIQNCVATVTCLALIILVREKPKTPPSASASQPTEVLAVRKELRNLLSNKNYLYLCVAFTCLNCICTCMGAVISSITSPYDYKARDNSIFGAVFIICGVVGTIVVSILLDRFHHFKFTFLMLAFVSVVSLGLAQLSLPSRSTSIFSINVAFLGFSGIPVAPVGNAFAVELTYPVPEAISNGMMNTPNIIFGFIMGIVSGVLCEYSPRWALLLFFVNSAVGGLAVFFIKEDLRRLKPKQVQGRVQQRSTVIVDDQ